MIMPESGDLSKASRSIWHRALKKVGSFFLVFLTTCISISDLVGVVVYVLGRAVCSETLNVVASIAASKLFICISLYDFSLCSLFSLKYLFLLNFFNYNWDPFSLLTSLLIKSVKNKIEPFSVRKIRSACSN